MQPCFEIFYICATSKRSLQIFNHIKRFLSFLLLIVFVLGITPKRFLHNVFAKHIDTRDDKNNTHPYQFNLSGYNCDTDNVVAESAFVADQHSLVFPILISFSSYILRSTSFTSPPEVYSALRGPPVNI